MVQGGLGLSRCCHFTQVINQPESLSLFSLHSADAHNPGIAFTPGCVSHQWGLQELQNCVLCLTDQQKRLSWVISSDFLAVAQIGQHGGLGSSGCLSYQGNRAPRLLYLLETWHKGVELCPLYAVPILGLRGLYDSYSSGMKANALTI